MNFFHPLLQSLQCKLCASTQVVIEIRENDQVLPPIYQITQQEILQSQLPDTNARVIQFDGLPNEKEIQKAMNKKISKKINTCGHPDNEHYAKGMCNNCYHRVGRNKQPWLCSHKKLYACGLCQNCYINQYNKKTQSRKLRSIVVTRISVKQLGQIREGNLISIILVFCKSYKAIHNQQNNILF